MVGFLDVRIFNWYGDPRYMIKIVYEPNADNPYLLIVVLLAGAVGFGLLPLALAWLWAKKYSPPKPGHDKGAIYECGLESKGDAWVQFKSEYYLYAIIFLIFDVETIFLLPFAV